jgi:hypothetical protein
LPEKRDIQLEQVIRRSILDSLQHSNRKPFQWGGLAGYIQLEIILEGLSALPQEEETAYLRGLTERVKRAVDKNRERALDLRASHDWLVRIKQTLRYGEEYPEELTGEQVRLEMEELLKQYQNREIRYQPAQAALYHHWQRLWKSMGRDLLPCYDIADLPADNLQIEAVFGELRRRSRRVSGRKSTKELREFGAFQVLFVAKSERDLMEQLESVPVDEYRQQRQRLEQDERERKHLRRLHHNPAETIQDLLLQHQVRRTALLQAHCPTLLVS